MSVTLEYHPAAAREAEGRFAIAVARASAADRLSMSREAAIEYAIRVAFSAETCLYQVGVAPWPKSLLAEGSADGTISAMALSTVQDSVPTFGGGTSAAVQLLKGQDASGPLAPPQALALHYLACQRALRLWARSARPFDGVPDVDLVIRPGSEGPTLPGTFPIPVPGDQPTVPGTNIPIPGSSGGGLILPGPPQGGNFPGMPGFDPSKPIVLPGPGSFGALGAVPSGIRQAGFNPAAMGIRKGFDPQPDPPGKVLFDTGKGGFIVYGAPGMGAVELGQTLPANLLLGMILIAGIGALAIAANAWVTSKGDEHETAVKMNESRSLSQVHLATELATQAFARGQPVNIPDIVRSIGGQELRDERAEPYLVGAGIAAAVTAIGFAIARAKGVV